MRGACEPTLGLGGTPPPRTPPQIAPPGRPPKYPPPRPPPPPQGAFGQQLVGAIARVQTRGVGPSDVLERPYTAGGGVPHPWTPPPPPPPPLPMFEAGSQNIDSAPSVPRGFTPQHFRPAFGGGHRGTLGGGGVPAKAPLPPFRPPPPSSDRPLPSPPSDPLPPPSNTSLGQPPPGPVQPYSTVPLRSSALLETWAAPHTNGGAANRRWPCAPPSSTEKGRWRRT